MAELIRTEHCKALTSKIATFRSSDKFCDVDILVDGKVFRCHRLVLSAASEYFDVMFNGNFKEGKAKEVTLQETKANVFERILEFLYTGETVIGDSSSVYDVIRAAEFYKLPPVLQLCTEFIEKNLNAVADDILKIFSFAFDAGIELLVKLLSKHIFKNFGYFSTSPDFTKLTFDGLMEVFNLIKTEQPAIEDAYLEGMYLWMSHQVNLTSEEMKSYSSEFMRKIHSTKLSLFYTRCRLERSMIELASSNSAYNYTIASDAVQRTKALHAYIPKISPDALLLSGTVIFTLHVSASNPKELTWVYSGELEFSADFMRNITIDDRLYSLRYSRERLVTKGPLQTFSSSTSLLMYPSSSLKPPPYVLDDFDMCGNGNNIYVYNKHTPIFSTNTVVSTEYSEFSREDLSRGMYIYNRDVDRWFPLPCPKTSVANACMTCNDEMIYLIGGSHSDKCFQAYDPRMREWLALAPTKSTYDRAACCAYGKEIYVAGGQHNPTSFEMYDPISGNWQQLRNLLKPRSDNHQLINWYLDERCERHGLVSFDRTLSNNSSRISTYTTDVLSSFDEKFWFLVPCLFDVVENSNFTFTADNCCILDMIYF